MSAPIWLNHYQCSECQTVWADEWCAQCDDRCPECDTEMEPQYSLLTGNYCEHPDCVEVA